MNDQNQIGTKRTSKRWGKGCLFWLVASLATLLGLALVGYIYEPIAEASDAKTYPPPGQLVDVGGYRLHLNCTGTGSPTVVIDSGQGDWSASWSSWVQPEVAKTTRVCTYDRAGYGWSESGSRPPTVEQFAKELHTLLQNAGIPGPYVLVGHSLGGFTVRVFVHEYVADVAGVVLVESMTPRQARPSATDTPPAATRSSGFSILTFPARIGLVRLFAGPLGLKSGLPPEVQPAYTAFSVTPRSFQTILDEGVGMPESLIQADTVKTFGDIPLIVLTGKLNTTPKSWQEWQTELLQLSSNSQQLFAEHSGHNIQLEQPEAAVAAIIQMVQQVPEMGTR
jgi:pimeloyl-ACP methyl ester carboxylesterase